MNVAFYIAKRYLISKKTTSAVNLISAISVLGVAVGTAAMIAVLSGFNGLESLIRSFYNTFDPDIKISATHGKYLPGDSTTFSRLRDIEGVADYALVLEDKALLKFHDNEFIATIKGVDQQYTSVTQFDSTISRGDYFGRMTDEVGILGLGVAYHLNIFRLDFVDPIQLYVPRQDYKMGLDPMNSVKMLPLYPIGIFSVQPEYDVKYVVTPINFARQLFEKPEGITSVELKINPHANVKSVQENIKNLLGTGYHVLDRNEQQVTIFRVIKIEGMATFLILAFILMIASFGIIGTLIMLILDKKQDIHTLRSLGATKKLIKRLFLFEGLLISGAGCILGLILGTSLVLLQDYFGFISLGQGYALDAYPVEWRWADMAKVFFTIMGIGSLMSWIAVRRLKTDI